MRGRRVPRWLWLVAGAAAIASAASAQVPPSDGDLVCCSRSSVDPQGVSTTCGVETLGDCGEFAVPIPGLVCCAIPPLAESCTGGPCTLPLPGSCAQGTYQCQGGGLACVPSDAEACGGTPPPCPESCDGLDNDCDGVVDDGFPTLTCGIGECRRQVRSCENGEMQDCVPGEPSPEVCNCFDDDCNGVVDDVAGGCNPPPVCTH